MNRKNPTAGIILAAGLSTRFGSPKQLADLGGKPLLQWVIDACLSSRLDKIAVVVGENASQIASGLLGTYGDPRLAAVINPQYLEGMSSSLRAGLAEIRYDFPSVMFLLGDQPLVSAALIDNLLERFRASDKDICVPLHRDRRGHPVLFSNRFYGELSQVSGDIGAREVIRAHPEAVLCVETADPLPFFDVDTKKDLETLCEMLKKI